MENYLLKYRNRTYPLEHRLDSLISSLTISEKISLLSTSQTAIPRLKLPAYQIGGEAAHGVVDRSGGKTTVFPQPIGLSSTWNKLLLKQVGVVIGEEARIFYENNNKQTGLTLWAPTIDMERDPRWGRTEEAYGEDPYLTGELTKELIMGMQGEDPFYVKLVAAPKHFYGNNNEHGREYISNSIDPRNRYEYYLKAFEPAFTKANALSMMTAYNGINGIPCMQIHEIKDIVRDKWRMDGFIVSDGGALSLNVDKYHYYDTYAEALADAMKKGIDCFVDEKSLVEKAAEEALDQRMISEEDITLAIRNILKVRFRLGQLDDDLSANPYHNVNLSKMCSVEHAEIALKATKESIVLLKNENNLLPLDEKKMKKLAVIGPTANAIYRDWYTGYSPFQITPLSGIKQRLKNKKILFTSGNDKVTFKAVSADQYLSINENDELVFQRIKHSDGLSESEVFEHEDWGWNGNLLKSTLNGNYVRQDEKNRTFEAKKNEVFDWFIREKIAFHTLKEDNQYQLSTWRGEPLSVSKSGRLIASTRNEIFSKNVITSGIAQAVKIAKESDTAIVFLGNNPMLNGKETEDRPDITLAEHQQKLIEAVYEVNKNVVVVIVGSYPFAVNWIKDNIPAVIYSAHGSQMLGEGLASIMLGDESPSGRLSMTWYESVKQLSSIFDYDVIRGNRTYMFIEEEPLFPFGFGLSYGKFQYRSMEVDTDTLKRDLNVKVKFCLENISNIDAYEVVQLYATIENSSIKRAKKQLIAFEKVKLSAKENKIVELNFHTNQLCFWDVEKEMFSLEKGSCLLSLRSSSEEVLLQRTVEVDGEAPVIRDLSKETKAENFDDYASIILNKGENKINCTTNQGNGWICFKNVSLNKRNHMSIRATTDGGVGKINVKLDNLTGDVIAESIIEKDLPWKWDDYLLTFDALNHIHDIYIFMEGDVSINTIQIK